MYVTVEYVSLTERIFRRGPLFKSSKRTIPEWLAGNEAKMNNLLLWSRDFYQIVINCIIHFRHLTFKELSKDGTYGVILVLPLHVVLDELDVADGLLQLFVPSATVRRPCLGGLAVCMPLADAAQTGLPLQSAWVIERKMPWCSGRYAGVRRRTSLATAVSGSLEGTASAPPPRPVRAFATCLAGDGGNRGILAPQSWCTACTLHFLTGRLLLPKGARAL